MLDKIKPGTLGDLSTVNEKANQIASGKTRLIYSSIEMSRSEGMQTFERHLSDLLKQGLLSRETVKLLAKKSDSIRV